MGVVVPNNYYNEGTKQYRGGHDGNIEEITCYYSPTTCYNFDANNLPPILMPHQPPANSSSSKSTQLQQWWVLNENNNNKLQFPSNHTELIENEASITTSNKLFVIASLLAQCGDIESNPGPKPKKGAEPKPDPQKIMEEKVGLF